MKRSVVLFRRNGAQNRRRKSDAPAGLRLTLRDLEILETLHTARYMTTPQIEALFWRQPASGKWGSVKACQRRLRLLTRHGLVRRIEQPVKRGEGSKPFVYTLDRRGAEVLLQELGLEPAGMAWRTRSDDAGYPFLEHLLATNDFRIAVTLACRDHPDVALETWVDEKELKTEAKETVKISGAAGGTRSVAIVPDAYVVLRVGERLGHLFLEIDRRTVTVQPTRWEQRGWTRKVAAYVAYHRSGAYYRRYRTHSLRILTVTTGRRRLAHLKQATEQAGGGSRFWFTTFDHIAPKTFLQDPIWYVAGKQDLHSLLR